MKCKIIIPINRQGRRHEFIASTVVQINNLLLSGDHVRNDRHDNSDLMLNKENIKVAIVALVRYTLTTSLIVLVIELKWQTDLILWLTNQIKKMVII